MKQQYNHDLITSFSLWLDNLIVGTGQAYNNVTGDLTQVTNSSIVGNIWSSPYQSWVYDSSVGGAEIPSGFYTASGQFLTRNSGIVIDFINGRVISPYNWGGTLTGTYSRKEVNVYYSSEDEVDFVLDQIYNSNKNISYAFTGFNGRALFAPFVILTNARDSNEPFALGGTDQTNTIMRAFIVSNSNYIQEGVNSLCRDQAHKIIPMANYTEAPINASGDIKGMDYSYSTGIRDKYGFNNGIYIENVHTYRLNEKANRNFSYRLSVLEFDLSKVRL